MSWMSEAELRRIGEMIAEEILYEQAESSRLDDNYDLPRHKFEIAQERRDFPLFVAAFPFWMF
jgi:hypothetical protein